MVLGRLHRGVTFGLSTLEQGSVKGQTVNILGCEDHRVSVAAYQLCHGSTKAAIDNKYTNECECVLIKLVTLKCELYLILIYHKVLYFRFVFQTFKNVKKKTCLYMFVYHCGTEAGSGLD